MNSKNLKTNKNNVNCRISAIYSTNQTTKEIKSDKEKESPLRITDSHKPKMINLTVIKLE